MATMKVELPVEFQTLCYAAAAKAREYADTLWAMARMKVELPEEFQTLCHTAAAKMELPEEFQTLYHAAAAKVEDFNPQECANTFVGHGDTTHAADGGCCCGCLVVLVVVIVLFCGWFCCCNLSVGCKHGRWSCRRSFKRSDIQLQPRRRTSMRQTAPTPYGP
jgi:GMP synthase-like glutamine amidotransferase